MRERRDAAMLSPMTLPRALAIADTATGHRRQVDALAAALDGFAFEPITLDLARPWRWLAPRGSALIGRALPMTLRETLDHAPPLMVLGCGRQAAAVLPWLARRYRAFTVQLLDPRVEPQRFDLVVAPHHDRLAGANVIATLGALNAVSPDTLAEALAERPTLRAYPAPCLALLIGGPTRHARIDAPYLDALLEHALAWHRARGGSILATASRRTPPALIALLRRRLIATTGLVWADSADGPNPYPALLAVAERVIVTADSVNLISEAAASGRPVYTVMPTRVSDKLARFHRALIDAGHLREWGGLDDRETRPTPLRETARVADAITRAFRAARA